MAERNEAVCVIEVIQDGEGGFSGSAVTKTAHKVFSVVYDKCVVNDRGVCLPFGYVA